MVSVQRAVEMLGIPTVLITVDREQSWSGRPPRALSPKGFKIGHSLGGPFQRELHLKVLLDALGLLTNPVPPGVIPEPVYAEYAPGACPDHD